MYDWGDLKYFLAVARAGSTLAAARALGVNQTTVARRIAALEEDLKLRLFDRNQDGYRLSENGALMLAQAERVAAEAETLERFVAQRDRHLCGTIRLTMAEAVANIVITPLLGEFMDLYPDIKVETIAVDRRLDLVRGDADIAIRAGHMPTEAGLVVRKLADGPWSLYCSKSYGKKRGVPKSADELNDHVIIGTEGALAKLEPHVWLRETAPRAIVRSVCSTNVNMMAAIKAGHGVGALPCSMGIVDPELVECFHLSQFKYHYFLVLPEALKDLPRIRAFIEFLNCRAAELKIALEGRPPIQPRVISSADEGAT